MGTGEGTEEAIMRGRLLMVTWEDSCTRGAGWQDGNYVKSLTPCIIDTVGWVLSESRDHIVLAASVSETGNVEGHMCIPTACIKRKRLLRQ